MRRRCVFLFGLLFVCSLSVVATADTDPFYKVLPLVLRCGDDAPVEIWSGGSLIDTDTIPFGYSFQYPPLGPGGVPLDVEYNEVAPQLLGQGKNVGMQLSLYDVVDISGGQLSMVSAQEIAFSGVVVRASGTFDGGPVITYSTGYDGSPGGPAGGAVTGGNVKLHARDVAVTGVDPQGWSIDSHGSGLLTGSGGDICVVAKNGNATFAGGLTAECVSQSPTPDDSDGALFINVSHHTVLTDEPKGLDLDLFSLWPGGVELNAGGHTLLPRFPDNFDPVLNPGDGDPLFTLGEYQFCSRGAVLYESSDPNALVYVLPAEPLRDFPDEINGRLMPSVLYDDSRENDIIRVWDVRPHDENEFKRDWTPDQQTGEFGAAMVDVDVQNTLVVLHERYASGRRMNEEYEPNDAVVVLDAAVAAYSDNRFFSIGTEYVSGYFDSLVEFDEEALVEGGSEWTFRFEVENLTPRYDALWDWLSYNFEFWDADFTQRLTSFPLVTWGDYVFGASQYSGGVLTFYPSAGERHDGGTTGTYYFTVDLSAVNGGLPGSFGIRQVATMPIPEPGSAALLLLGGALGLRRRRR